jgi:hypothetical protein
MLINGKVLCVTEFLIFIHSSYEGCQQLIYSEKTPDTTSLSALQEHNGQMDTEHVRYHNFAMDNQTP